MLQNAIKPLCYYVDVDEIVRSVQKLNLEELLTYLGQYGMVVWRIAPNLFVALDHETKHKNLRRVSILSIPLSRDNLLKLALELAYNVKLYTETDLRNILQGLIAHKEYSYSLGFVIPCMVEVKVVNKTKKIVGIADIVCNDSVIELKLGSHLRREHVYQLLIYMDLLQKQHGFLVYKDKVFKYSLKTNPNILSEAYARLHEIYHKVNLLAKRLPSYKNVFLNRFSMKVHDIMKRLDELTLVV